MFDPARGYPAVVPLVGYADVEAGMAWLIEVLGARGLLRHVDDAGVTVHAEIAVGAGVIQLGRRPDAPAATTLVFVDDVDAAVDRAAARGGRVVRGAGERPWGLRQATVADPHGHHWELSAHVRDVPLAEWGAQSAA